ncbi:uncharacterized protein LOC121367631 [Gigantopelta aegis]|uniref:uncharacterized protein LOC121367631 n=1 Tax=Gigantopelta aegis TaxID=1735272 RepID=UPI001B88AB92|nr:uncharacterized protein LOC121367631 [Gigantopelta aegis]
MVAHNVNSNFISKDVQRYENKSRTSLFLVMLVFGDLEFSKDWKKRSVQESSKLLRSVKEAKHFLTREQKRNLVDTRTPRPRPTWYPRTRPTRGTTWHPKPKDRGPQGRNVDQW